MFTAHKLQGAGGVGGNIITNVSVTNTATYTRTTAHFNYTGISVNIGAADPNRYIVVCVGGYTSAAVPQYVSSISLNSTPCLKFATPSFPNGYASAAGIGVLKIPTGTTATLGVQFFSSTNMVDMSSARIYRVVGNLKSATPVATGNAYTGFGNTTIDLNWSGGDNAAVFAAYCGYETGLEPSFTVLTGQGYEYANIWFGGAYNATEVSGTSATITKIGWDGLSSVVGAIALK